MCVHRIFSEHRYNTVAKVLEMRQMQWLQGHHMTERPVKDCCDSLYLVLKSSDSLCHMHTVVIHVICMERWSETDIKE